MQLRIRRNGLLMATPAEEAEANQWLDDARTKVRKDIVDQVQALNKEIARRRFRKALEVARCLTESLIELELYYT